MRFEVDEELFNTINAICTLKDEKSLADTCRRILKEAVGKELLESGIDSLTPILRRVIKEEFKLSENRLAKINAKAAIGSATAMYMTYQALRDLGTKDMPAIYEAARTKAVNFVKTPLDENVFTDKD